MEKVFTMLLTSIGTTTVLTEALVPYELKVSSETKINTMDTLGEGYISQSVGVYIKKGGKIATVCKLTNNFATLKIFRVHICSFLPIAHFKFRHYILILLKISKIA